MSRVSDDDLRRLASALSHPDASTRHEESGSQRAAIDHLKAELTQMAGDDALGRALTQLLAAYLNRPVRAVAGGASGAIPGAWRYVAESGPVQWWIEFEAPLAASLADAMLGGAGTAAKAGAGRRTRSLVGKIADLFFDALSSAAGAPRPLTAVWTDEARHPGAAELAGRCAVTAEPFAWQAGVTAVGEAAHQPEIGRRLQPRQVSPSSAISEPAVIAEIRATIVAACAGLSELLGCPVAVATPTVTELDAPDVSEAALRLALTTGGKGSLIVCAQRDAVVAFASGAVGGQIPDAGDIGSVVCAAAEAVLREIIHRIAGRLTPISGAPQRTVFIAADAQLARTQHIEAAVTLRVAGNAANLRVLVPRWMASSA
jgi:hypothetical protein